VDRDPARVDTVVIPLELWTEAEEARRIAAREAEKAKGPTLRTFSLP